MTLLLTCLFVLSGAAGLIYESIWSRYLGLFVGHSAYAQVIVLVIFLAFGISFELPVAVVILVVLGVVTPAQLREARGYVVVGVFILAAIITPPDVVSQLMLAIPLCLLYEVGIIAGALLKPRPAVA